MDELEADRKALEEFIVGNADLEKLEAMLDRFNIFEAVGMSRQEIRHSMFLSFLLDPNQPHGMGNAFLKRFLQSAVSGSSSAVVTPIELSLWNLAGATVQREWNYIDIFLLDEENRLAVIIENKIGTSEHSNQLERYYDLVREQYPEYRILAIYLTPNGDEPSHLEYLPLGYGTVCEILDEVRQSRSSVMEPDAAVLTAHYTDMMRRNIVGDSEIARLAQQIYQKHQRAIDLIYEQRPNIKVEIKNIMDDIVDSEPRLVSTRDEQGASKISFGVRHWDTSKLLSSVGSADERILSFQLFNYPSSFELVLFIKPGPQEIREKLFEVVRSNPDILKFSRSWGDWTLIFTRELLEKRMYERVSSLDREAEIRKNWNDFLENDLPRIDAALRAEDWIWKDSEPISD